MSLLLFTCTYFNMSLSITWSLLIIDGLNYVMGSAFITCNFTSGVCLVHFFNYPGSSRHEIQMETPSSLHDKVFEFWIHYGKEMGVLQCPILSCPSSLSSKCSETKKFIKMGESSPHFCVSQSHQAKCVVYYSKGFKLGSF